MTAPRRSRPAYLESTWALRAHAVSASV